VILGQPIDQIVAADSISPRIECLGADMNPSVRVLDYQKPLLTELGDGSILILGCLPLGPSDPSGCSSLPLVFEFAE